MTGEAMRLLGRFGRRYAAAVRMATLLPIAAIALLRAAPENLPAIALAVTVAVAWTCGYAWWLRGSAEPLVRGAPRRLPVALDVLVLQGVCLSILWTGALEDLNTGWVRLLVTFACVTAQWHTTPLAGAALVLVVDGTALLVLEAAGAGPSALFSQAWVLIMAALSRVAWILVTRAADRADRLAATAERVRGEALVASAVRAGERELSASLHDTAATTLLMVGTGQVSRDAAWLAPQVSRDLERLHRMGDPAARPSIGGAAGDPRFPEPGRADLVALLRADLDATRLDVGLDGPASLDLPLEVAQGIADAAREALNNVRRHAGTERAVLRLRDGDGSVRLEITDEGRGFAAAAVPDTRRGLSESVHGRMRRLGGTATITSAKGRGTRVLLEWSRAR